MKHRAAPPPPEAGAAPPAVSPPTAAPTSASVCYTYLLDKLLLGKKHTIVVGQTGTAKSVVVMQKLTRLDSKYLGSGPCPGCELPESSPPEATPCSSPTLSGVNTDWREATRLL